MQTATISTSGQDLRFLAGGGEMGALMRAHDWSSSSLGEPGEWPQALRTAVRLMLNTGHPMYIFWGPQGICFYNDAYRQSIGPERHPSSLGRPAREVWDEIWDIIGPQIEQVMAGRGATWHENALVPITRHGVREDVYWTYSYGPIDDETAPNGVGGVLVVCTETTQTVLANQRKDVEQERQRTLFQQMPGFVAVLSGPDHVFEYVNTAYIALAGERDYLGRGVRQNFPELAGQPFFDLLDDVYTKGKPFSARGIGARLASHPGERFIDLLYEPIRDGAGNVTGIFVGGYDVTEAYQTARHMRAIADLADRMRDIEDPDDLAYAAAEILGRTLGVSRAGYGTINVANETITIERDWNMPGVQSLAGTLHFRDYGSYIEDLKRGVTAVVEDAYKDSRTAEGADALKAISAQAFVNMPVTEQGGFVALLYLNHADAREWTEAELSLIRDVADRTRTAVERRRAEIALRANEARLRFLDKLARGTQGLGDADAVLATTTRLTAEHMGASVCAYADMDPDQDGFTIRGDWAAPGARSIVGHYSLATFGKLAVKNLAAGEPLVVNDNAKELAPEEAATFQNIGIRATICMPLVKEGRLTALMAVHHAEPHQWTEEELATIREVTERSWAHVQRVGAEAVRRESEARYQQLFESIDEGFCIIEFFDGPHGPLSDYVHVEANPAYTANAGIPDVVGQKVREMVPDEAQGWVDLYREVLVTGNPIRFEKELEATGRWLELAAFRVEPASRKQVAVLFKDLTEKKRAEEALKELNTTLEKRVQTEVSDRMLAEEALRQSQKMEAVGQLTGGIAHDFNNLLGGISGSLELLDKRLSEGRIEGVQRYINSAQEASRRAASLTQRLLAFSRRQTLDPRPMDANRLISGMEDLIRRTVGPSITLEVVGAGGLWPTKIDASQLESALLNLCINARDAMTPDGGRLTIETANKWLDERAARERELPPGQYVSICVTDTGAGMTPDIIARAFDPFFTTKPIGQGTGLGLSMVYGFVRQSNGQVRIYSEVGKGTTMCLYLPRYFGEVDEPQDAGHNETIDKGHGETVLVIDDEPLLRMLVIDVLEENGYRSLEAVDGPSGLRILQSDARIDLLITDVGLPGGMNGRQVAEQARKTRPDLKVLFITGYAENALIGHGHLEPGMQVLTKPFPVATLGQRIRDMIER